MNADIVFKVHGRDSSDLGRKIEAIDAIARTPQEVPPGLPGEVPVVLPGGPPGVLLPEVKPYFDIGDAEGKAGELVTLSIVGGCRYPTTGFHIGGGLSGYGKFEAVGAKLGPFLKAYLEAEDVIHDEPNHQHEHFWSIFQMVKAKPHRALPTEWWEYAIGFFSLGQKRTVPPTTIPSGQEIFALQVKILEGTAPGVYDLSCLDETYYTHSHQRRRDFMFTADRDSEFARGGITKLDLAGGKITVVAA